MGQETKAALIRGRPATDARGPSDSVEERLRPRWSVVGSRAVENRPHSHHGKTKLRQTLCRRLAGGVDDEMFPVPGLIVPL